uniref:Uncharacterized protein n=1 Tax=Tetranychus urticae TaxID=32264 RepID=T1JZQ6_TETUR
MKVSLLIQYPETNEPHVQSMSVDDSANLLLPSTSTTDTSTDKSNEKHEDECEDVAGKAEAMKEMNWITIMNAK